VKRNRFIKLVGATKAVNRGEAKARGLAGIKGYVTNLTDVDADFVIGAYHRLFEIEKSFRMSKHDLQARPSFHHKRESIGAHLAVVFAALAVSRLVETETGWSINRFVRTAHRYREVTIEAGDHTITAADRYPTSQPHLKQSRPRPMRTKLSQLGDATLSRWVDVARESSLSFDAGGVLRLGRHRANVQPHELPAEIPAK
jgi:hypothetical protein